MFYAIRDEEYHEIEAASWLEAKTKAREELGLDYNWEVTEWPPEAALATMWQERWEAVVERCDAIIANPINENSVKDAKFSRQIAERHLRYPRTVGQEEQHRQCLDHLRVAEANNRPSRGWAMAYGEGE